MHSEKNSNPDNKDTITIESGYTPGLIGRIAELHGVYYHTNWNFGLYFEAKVASGSAQFLSRFEPSRDGVWFPVKDGRPEGVIVIDGLRAEDEGAHLRWFIVSGDLRGKGIGRRLMRIAMEFCAEKGYNKVCLWTFEGLHAARRLYEESGFRLVKERIGSQWGTEVNEQYFELNRIEQPVSRR